ERRPDIPYISLTCENTNTALPYIDVVNEILEYYVTNSALSEQAARNTGQTTTAELLAEPQNIISAAYHKLQQARYPLALPFDLWVETVRQFCDYFETPFWKLLEIFCPHSDLFAPTQPFDLASIFAEQLGLSPAELAIFANPDPLANWHQLYGYETEAEAATPALDPAGQRIDLNSAKALARRLGITYQEVAKVIETEFVNPKLANLTVLYRLEVSVHDIFYYKENKEFYEKNEDLLGKERTELSAEDQQRFDQLSNKSTTTDKTGWQVLSEVQGFLERLETATAKFASFGFDAKAWLQTALEENEFDKVLVLADPAVGSNFDLTTLRYANGNGVDPIALLKINLFVRLWRKLGWTIEETDRALNVFLPKNAPFEPEHFAKQPLKTALIYLAHLKALDGEIKIGKDNRLKLLTFWSDLSRTGQRPLYAELFLTQAALKSGEVEITADGWSEHLSIFDHPLGQYLTAAGLQAMAERVKHEVFLFDVNEDNKIDPEPLAEEPKLSLRYDSLGEVQYLSYEGILSDSEKLRLIALSQSDNLATLLGAVQKKARDFSLVKTHVLALQGALGLTAEEIAGILKHAGISSETAELSLESLSLLYRYGTLAKALKLKLSDLIILKRLSGLDPFKPLHPEPLADVEQVDAPPLKARDFDHLMTQTLAFVKMAKQIEGSGLKIEDLAYLLCHKYDETGKYRPGGDARVALLRTVCDGVRSIRIEHAVPADPSEESLRQKLSLVLTPNAVESLVGMVNRTTRLTETAARQFFDHELKKQKLRLSDEAGFLEEADFQTLFKSLKPLLKIEVGDTAETIDEKGKQNEMIEEENRIELQVRRRRVAQAFLPFLQRRFIRQFVVQTVTAGTAASAALVEGFLTDERLLGTPQPLLESLAATGERGANVSFFDAGGANLGEQRLFSNADTGSRDTEGKRLAPEGAKSARFEGYLEVPASGAYRFAIQFDKKGAEAELRFDELANLAGPFLGGVATDDGAEIGSEADKFIELQAGVPYQFAFDVKKLNEGDVRLLVQGTTLPKGPLAQLTLYPRNAFDDAANALILLTKGLQLAQTFNLSEREVRHLFNVNNPEGFDLSKLPHHALSDADFETARDRFTQLLNLTVYSNLKKDLGTETDDLVDVFEATQLETNRAAIARLARREKVTVNLVIKALFGDNPSLITSQTKLSRLWQALHIVERIGVPVEALLEWTRIISPATLPAKRFAIAHDLKEALKAQLEPEAWLRVAQPIFDKLRQRQRDALVAFVKHQQGFINIEQLYEYFLIDPGMEPVVQTSRIR
ncbi:MAG TPA: neuraminidase-like domain-containing protein, partial [Terrimicrobiaceae bacterium]